MQRIELLFTVGREHFDAADTGDAAICVAVQSALEKVGINLDATITETGITLSGLDTGIPLWLAPLPDRTREFIYAYNGTLHLTVPHSGRFIGFFSLDSDDKPCTATVGFTDKLRFMSY
jgi:hypothetical protein